MMTYDQYKLLKRISKHSGKDENFYIKRYGKKIQRTFEKARDSNFVDYETTGFSKWGNEYICGMRAEYNKVWIICDRGERAFDEYKEHLHDLWSGRIFSIIVSVITAILSFAGSIIFQIYFHKSV
ncbi:hypothetical protein FL966_06040 [Caproiciproducens galactitolivorans]|uniref:Uncharacterized protein n=1 Tax=Caproiciproducens galactitolivorans TaxID=642589 RepID=A0A4Z0Y9C1_9FIRM|nr:hypothetical protein [Caproiciproducens galactitolivorans]QEY34649.1 hypothetical protein FL966_06040 [Caproiciproducens galactitolivorans]TGJ75881.1 hypothetical protein CAGA_20890 [Caproiciproducens galactitolivorans]